MTTIALFGNPNTGKTSLFNNLTGSYEYVGNWSGVTVEKKVGILRNKKGELIDLPGVYSLNPISRDESVVSEFLLKESFHHILNIVDASQLRRNLRLTLQLLEVGKPLVMGLNMIDVAKLRGISIDVEKLSRKLGITIVPIVARSGKGCDELSQVVTNEMLTENKFSLYYGAAVEKAISQIEKVLPDTISDSKRWVAIQVIEGNRYLQEHGDLDVAVIEEIVQQAGERVRTEHRAKSAADHILHVRDEYISKLLHEVTSVSNEEKRTMTERIDAVVTHPVLGIPIFLIFMYLMFMLTFDWIGSPSADFLDGLLSGPVTDVIQTGLQSVGASDFIQSLVLEGVVAGVGGVLVFVPQIFILFFLISFLEDSGYMSRVAMVMDRIMESIGLNGKAFIPMIIGFGCNVPGVMAARTIEQPKERLLTILLTPLMSCSARLPVYALFVGTFFAANQGAIVLSLYVLGIIVAMLLAKLFSMTILKGEQSVFVIELPPYRVPQFLTLWRSTWDKGKGFIRKAGTFIFGGSVAIWVLTYLGPSGTNVVMDDSFLSYIGGVLAPILAPLGFGTWQAAAALLTGFLAKEVVVSTMNIIYHVPDTEQLQGLMTQYFTPLSAFSFMVFVLLYVPCLATVATIQKETRSKKWTFFSIGYALVIAYVLSLVIYQVGSILGIGV